MRDLLGCFMEDFSGFQRSSKGVSRMFQMCFKEFSRAFQRQLHNVSREVDVMGVSEKVHRRNVFGLIISYSEWQGQM